MGLTGRNSPQTLFQAGELKWGTDEEKFITIFGTRSVSHLRRGECGRRGAGRPSAACGLVRVCLLLGDPEDLRHSLRGCCSFLKARTPCPPLAPRGRGRLWAVTLSLTPELWALQAFPLDSGHHPSSLERSALGCFSGF